MADKKIYPEKVPTGINGLDEAMFGGLIRNSINLVGGGPGNGKSILGLQFLINGINKYNENGVYITFEESSESIKKNMAGFGWDIEELEKRGKLAIIKLSPIDIEPSPLDSSKTIASTLSLRFKIIKKINAKRLVIDSVSAYSLLYPDELGRRKSQLELFNTLREWDCTSLIIEEYNVEENRNSAVEYLVDTIIWLYNIKKEDVRSRSIEIIKMRGSKHSTKTSAMEISDKGIKVYPKQTVY